MTTAITSCAHCRTVLLPGQRQCLVCGAEADEPARTCPACGHAAPVSARFCTRCGHSMQRPAVAATPGPTTEVEFAKVRNPGAKAYLSIGAAVLVLLALVSAHSFVSATFFTPQRAVTGYFDALAARDAGKALSYLAPIQTSNLLLTDAVLKHEGYGPPANITVGEVPGEGDERVVPVSFELDGKVHRLDVYVRRAESRTFGVFRGWVIGGGLSTVDVVAPRGVRPTINGVAIPESARTLPAFPGQYRMGIVDSPMLEVRETTATVTGRHSMIRLIPALKDSVRAEVEAQAKSYVDECAKSAKLEPDGCPFSVFAFSTVTGVKWTITTYPTLTVTVSPETGSVNVGTTREGRADAAGTYSDGTAFSRSDFFRVTGTAVHADGKVRFTPRL